MKTIKEAEVPNAESLAAKVESVERPVRELREEIAAYERPRVKSAAELAWKIARREVTDEELRERGRELRGEWERRFGKLD
jgi:hypothetical protein